MRGHLRKWKEKSVSDLAKLQWFDFEPWVLSAHQDLASAFFKVLLEKLGFIIDHIGGVASKAGAAVTKAAIKKGSEKWLAEPSLQKAYDQLVTSLAPRGAASWFLSTTLTG